MLKRSAAGLLQRCLALVLALTLLVPASQAGMFFDPAGSGRLAIPGLRHGVLAAPSFTSASSITGTPAVGSTLTAVPGATTGSPTLAYQWQSNGANIAGATAATYTIPAGDAGGKPGLVITATNAAGSATSSALAASYAVDPALTDTARLAMVRGQVVRGFYSNASYQVAAQQLITRTVGVAPTDIAFVYFNGRLDASNGQTCNANNVTVQSGIERLGATNIAAQMTFDGGATSHTATPCEIFRTDFLPATSLGASAGATLPANTFFAAKTIQTAPALGGSLLSGTTTSPSTVATGGVTGNRTDQNVVTTTSDSLVTGNQVWATGAFSASGGITTAATAGPIAIIGHFAAGATPPVGFIWVGDSIGDTSYPSAFNLTTTATGVFPEQALKSIGQRPYVKVAIGSATEAAFTSNFTALKEVMKYGSTTLLEQGTNDIAQGASAATLYANDNVLARAGRARGQLTIMRGTIAPRTTSAQGAAASDGSDQAFVSGWESGGVVDQHKALVQAGLGTPGGMDVLVDWAGPLKQSAAVNKWLSNGTANNLVANNDNPNMIHPNNAGATAAAAPLATAIQALAQ